LGAAESDDLARFVECPTLVLRNGEPDGLDAACRHLKQLGVPWEFWDLEKLTRRVPAFDTRKYAPPRLPDDPRFGEPAGGALEGALYFPDGGYVTDPQLAARNLQRAAETHGAAFRFNANVTAVRIEHGRAAGVELSGGETVAAPVVVNAAGPYSAIVNRMAGVLGGMAIRTRPLRQEVCHVERPKELGLEGPLAGETALVVLDADTGGYFRTEHDHALLIGGMEPDCDPRVWVDDPDTFERGPSELWQAQVMRQALRLPGLGIPGQARGVADLYDVSDDWVPIYDKSDVPGFYMAVGTSGNQFKNGPVAGQMMAGLIDACERGLDHDASPYRFPLAYTGLTLDCAAFSRRRAATADSTMSVLG
jgi:sarcosine oxidase subunit beta